MEQVRVQPRREQPRLRCPRCGSLDTRFRYFNNYSNTQPRYLCRRCNRQWTVGGTLRHIPFGGRTRPGKKTKLSTLRSQLPQPPFQRVIIPHEYLQNSHIFRPPRILIPQEFLRNSHISCLDVVQPFLMEPQVMNHHANYGDQAFLDNANMEIPQVCNNQLMLSQDLSQQIPTQSGSYLTHGEGNNSPMCFTSLVHPPCLMNALPQDSTANTDIFVSNALRKNYNGDSSNIESDTTPVDVDEWLDLSGYDSS